MKIATWNLRRLVAEASVRAKIILAEMHRVNADIWVLTETHDNIRPADSYESVASDTPDRTHSAGERWAMIWSRYPIERAITTSDASRAVAVRVTPPRGADLIVYGSVLPWLGSNWQEHPAKNGEAFKSALTAQRSDWEKLRTANKDCELIVAGDLNQDLADKHFYGSNANRRLLKQALSACDLRAVAASSADPVPVHAPRRSSVDHICVPIGATRWADATVGSWPETDWPLGNLSDHFGLFVESRDG